MIGYRSNVNLFKQCRHNGAYVRLHPVGIGVVAARIFGALNIKIFNKVGSYGFKVAGGGVFEGAGTFLVGKRDRFGNKSHKVLDKF